MNDKEPKPDEREKQGKQLQRKQREAEGCFADVMRHLPAAAWIKDLAGRYVYANAEAERIFARPLPALLGKTDFDLFPEETARRFVENDQRVLAEGGSIRTTELLTQADGVEHCSIVSKFAIFGNEGNPTFIAGVAFDITERKHAEDALKEMGAASEESRIKLEAIVNSMTDALGIADTEGNIVSVNPAAVRLLGFDSAEQARMHITKYPETFEVSDLEGRPLPIEAWPICRAIRGEVFTNHEIRLRRRDTGQEFIGNYGGTPIRNHDNRIVSALITIRDVTTQKQVEQSLRKSNELSNALNRINTLIFSTLDFDEIMRRVLKESAAATGADSGVLYMPIDGSWIARFAYGESQLEGKHFTEEQIQYSIAAVSEKKTIRANNLTGEEEQCRFLASEYGVKAVLDAPLLVGEEIIGDFALYSCSTGEIFSQLHEDFVNKVAAAVSLAVKNARLFTSLRDSEERFRAIADNISQFAWIADEKGRIFWYNKQWYDYTGIAQEEMAAWGWEKSQHPDHLESVLEKIKQSLKAGAYWEDTFPLRGKQGQFRWFLSRAVPIRDQQGRVTRWFGTGTDITERREIEEDMRQIAHHDPLTGLPNRRLFIEIINVEREQARRNGKKMAVLFLDLDRFKEVNDTLGHQIGDQLLRETASRIRSVVRSSDTVARMGGDEFNILLTDLKRSEDTADIARNIIASFRQPFLFNEHELNLTTSIGISVYPEDSNDIDTLLRFADIAMYYAKEQGRNQHQFYNQAINVKSLEIMKLENMLRQSIEKGEMTLYYQPQINVRSKKVTCAEALLRWNHPEKGIVEPDEFIPLAEENGFINALDAWAVKAACIQIKKWQAEGLPPICVTVNLASRCLQSPNEVELITEILQNTGVDPRCLDLEITETTAMAKIERTGPTLTRLSNMGIGISIDDFGKGYSSLSYLKKLPVNRIKIDKSFLTEIPQNANDRAIFSAVTAMAHTMKMTVVAEGVETKAQLDFVSKTGCDEVQGFVFSKPLPPEEFRKFLKAA